MGSPADFIKNPSAEPYKFTKSQEMFVKATTLVPGGINGHQSPALCVPGSFPYFIEKMQGSRFWDVDGNEYIDYMCAYGPMVVGYNNPNVEKAVEAQRQLGNCGNLPGPLFVKLAERLVNLVTFADWAIFAKNGSDVTSWSLLVAREYTGKKKILMAEGTYHGAHAWCTPMPAGVTKEDRMNIAYFKWNDIEGFKKKAAELKGELAGVIVTPFSHEAFHDNVLPDKGFFQAVREVCDEQKAVMILDDVRCGFRLDLKGSNEYFGFEPDIACYCKAIANGYPISAAVGRKHLMNSAGAVYFTGSYWTSAGPMAAALATIDELERTDGIATMMKMGKLLMDGLVERGKKHGLQLLPSGPTSIPFIRFKNENNFMRQQLWCAESAKRGLFFHPHHNWFMSTAHTEEDINQTLDIAEIALKIVKDKFGS